MGGYTCRQREHNFRVVVYTFQISGIYNLTSEQVVVYTFQIVGGYNKPMQISNIRFVVYTFQIGGTHTHQLQNVDLLLVVYTFKIYFPCFFGCIYLSNYG